MAILHSVSPKIDKTAFWPSVGHFLSKGCDWPYTPVYIHAMVQLTVVDKLSAGHSSQPGV